MWDAELLDVKGLLCPMPIIRLQNRSRELTAGARLWLQATDAAVLQDIPAWCRIHGHGLVQQQELHGIYHFLIQLHAGRK